MLVARTDHSLAFHNAGVEDQRMRGKVNRSGRLFLQM